MNKTNIKKLGYIFCTILCAFFITACSIKIETGNNNDGDKKIVDKYEQLGNYLISIGWEKGENSQYDFSLKVRDILDDDGKPVNVDWYFLNIKDMKIQRTTRISQLSTTNTYYSLKSNIANGTYILLNEKDEWDKHVSFTYDFNSGSLTSDDNSSSSLCTSSSIGLKEKLEGIIEDSGLEISDFK